MAVYTVLTAAEIDALATTLDLGKPCAWRGVEGGIENSTYFVSCRRDADPTLSEYVLTIAEATARPDVIFVAEWMTHLARSGLPVPEPQRHPISGSTVITVQGKPAIVVPKIAGEHLSRPEPSHCAAVGHTLGAMHAVALRSSAQHQSPRGLDWLAQTSAHLLPLLDDADRQLVGEELARLEALQQAGLPVGIIHGDLFRDNALFRGPELGAVIDFFMAGTGPLAFDLTVAINDWCSRDDLTLDPDRVAALLAAYECERSLTSIERACWSDLLCLAATRFWVSRLQARLEPRPTGPNMRPDGKDPDQLRRMLLLRRATQ